MEMGMSQEGIQPKRIILNNKEINAPIEMMVKDYDDEKTLDSEDTLEEGAEEQSNQQKTIMVGSDYQAFVPEGLWKYDDVLPYENEDKLLWDPSTLSLAEIEVYMVKAQEPLVNNTLGVNAIPVGNHTRDDEQALYLLLQCGYNMEEALRRRRMNVVPAIDTMSLWSEEECRHFENGLRTFGKNFHVIQQNKVRTRSVGELVQFYYLWKKTERHDVFANKARLEKKKYTLHPGVTYVGIRDYMDRFCDEQESGSSGLAGAGSRDRSASPNIQCLIYGDPKRQHRVSESLSHFDKDSHEALAASFSTGDGNNCSLETGVGLSSLKSSCVSDNATSGTSIFITNHQTMAQ